MYPENLWYTRTHEWVRAEGKILTFGITFYAQDRLEKKGQGITYIGLPGGGPPMFLPDGWVVDSRQPRCDCLLREHSLE